MTPQEIAKACVDAINMQPLFEGQVGKPFVTLRMPPSKHESKTRYFYGPKTPKGIVLSRMGDYDVVRFEAVDLLAFLAAQGVVKIEPLKDGIT